MGLDNVAVQWPRTGRFYDPVAPAEFVDFADLAERLPIYAGPASALADHIAKTGTVRVTGYTELVDLLFGLNGVLFATDAAAEDEEQVDQPRRLRLDRRRPRALRAGPPRLRRRGDVRQRQHGAAAGPRGLPAGRPAAALAAEPARCAA